VVSAADLQAGELIVTRCEGAVAWVVLNRPQRMNALVGGMRDDLHRAIAAAVHDDRVRAVVITGEGRAFCSGADIGTMAALLQHGDEDTFVEFMKAGMQVVREIRASPKPVIAAVNGAAAGAGASLALACDLRVASSAASIGLTFNRIGLHPDWGATYFLPRLVGRGRATELVFSGRMLDAGEAERVGIFERVIPEDEFQQEVAKLAAELAAKPPLAIGLAKRNLSLADRDELEVALQQEAEAQLHCFRSADAREGITAFKEKRAPLFSGA
jgi:2-(1,2-epoxy-1,2-dihydrophenyl)acetyl-CoA isomerase